MITGKMIVKALKAIPTEGLTHDDLDELVQRTQLIMQTEYFSLATQVLSYLPKDYSANIVARQKLINSINS